VRVDILSDSAILRMTSEKDGTEPVVMAFIRGIVTVGELAWAVKGIASPVRINLQESIHTNYERTQNRGLQRTLG
jgi:hypothetical protein